MLARLTMSLADDALARALKPVGGRWNEASRASPAP